MVTDDSGSFSFVNVTAGRYRLTVEAAGFQKVEITDLDLLARETKRVDASLKAGAATETVNVEGGAIGVVTTDASNISANRTGQELVDLPVAIYSRSTGSTSPISTLTTQPGSANRRQHAGDRRYHLGPHCRYAGRHQHHEN